MSYSEVLTSGTKCISSWTKLRPSNHHAPTGRKRSHKSLPCDLGIVTAEVKVSDTPPSKSKLKNIQGDTCPSGLFLGRCPPFLGSASRSFSVKCPCLLGGVLCVLTETASGVGVAEGEWGSLQRSISHSPICPASSLKLCTCRGRLSTHLVRRKQRKQHVGNH